MFKQSLSLSVSFHDVDLVDWNSQRQNAALGLGEVRSLLPAPEIWSLCSGENQRAENIGAAALTSDVVWLMLCANGFRFLGALGAATRILEPSAS